MFNAMIENETDLFGMPFIPVKAKNQKLVKSKRNFSDVINRKHNAITDKELKNDFFGDDELAQMYISGVSSISDLKGCIKSNKAICVNKVDMSKPATAVLIDYLNTSSGGLVFIDSGAFRVIGNNKIESLNFDDVFTYYSNVIENIEYTNRLTVCAPDVIGDQSATISLQKQYSNEIKRIIDLGANVMFPLQRGDKPLSEVYYYLCELFGSDNVVVGLPSNAKAIPVNEFMDFLNEKPKRVHLLGVKSDKKIVRMGVHKSPSTQFSCDSNRPKAYIGQGEPVTELSKVLKFQAIEVFDEILDNSRGEVYVTNDNKWLVETLDVELDYTEFDAELTIGQYSSENLQSLCKKLEHNVDVLTPTILIEAVSQGTFIDFFSELYTFEFACLLHDEVWEHYRAVMSKDLTEKKASPKARTQAIHLCCESGIFD